MIEKCLSEINSYSGSTIDPLRTPNTTYELYSVPSFDDQYPEIILGANIGSSKVTVEKNDVLVCKINPRINRVWVVKQFTQYKLIASSEWIIVRNSEINPDYLKWYFSSPIFRKFMTSHVTGIGGSLTRAQPKQVGKYPVPIVSKAEQDYIVACLEKVANLISLRKQQLFKLDELVKSQFIEMFGDLSINIHHWPMCKLINVCAKQDDIKCGPFGTQLNRSEYTSSGIALWGIPQINAAFTKQPEDFISTEKAINLDSYSIIPGDIAMSRKGNVGKCAIYPENFPAGVIHSDVLRIRPGRNIVNSLFLMQQLHISPIVETQIGMVSSGAIMAGINVTKLKNIMVHVPPIDLQNHFASFIESTDKSKFAINKSLSELEMLKKALMQQFFG